MHRYPNNIYKEKRVHMCKNLAKYDFSDNYCIVMYFYVSYC